MKGRGYLQIKNAELKMGRDLSHLTFDNSANSW